MTYICVLNLDEQYMSRCLRLALLGAGSVAPNPMVGACLVYEGRIIGEGWHEQYGGPHAEVNCLHSVKPADRHLIPDSVLYVSLEPCNHFGKTPPCAHLIIENRIRKVVIGSVDPNVQVNGSGIQMLKENEVDVVSGILERECLELNRRFFTFHRKQRPYILLKWAQTSDGHIAKIDGTPMKISGEMTDRLVHQWRSEESAILVGTKTLLNDNPALTNRLWPGKNPLRVVIDKKLNAPRSYKIYDGQAPTLIFNQQQSGSEAFVEFILIEAGMPLIEQINRALHRRGILSLMVEGGTKTIEAYLKAGVWDEARIITNTCLTVGAGVQAPDDSKIKNTLLQKTQNIGQDTIEYYRNEIG